MEEIIIGQTLVTVTDEYRNKRRLSLFGLICSGAVFKKSGKWFGFVLVRERLHIVRYEKFDDGWTYQNYWGRPYREWNFVNFI